MAAGKFKHPQVVVANRLGDGVVVWLGSTGWVERIDAAVVGHDPEAVAGLVARGEASAARQEVIDVYPIDVRVDGSTVRPIAIKEAIRAKGPTVRTDLGKQAERAEI